MFKEGMLFILIWCLNQKDGVPTMLFADSDSENEELLDNEGNENDNVSNNEIIFPD